MWPKFHAVHIPVQVVQWFAVHFQLLYLLGNSGDTEYIGGTGQFLHSKEVVTQVDPLDMMKYGSMILPLIMEIQVANPQVKQMWYPKTSYT